MCKFLLVSGKLYTICEQPWLIRQQDDRSEIDIETVTPGTSPVNNTINYTIHPSLDMDGLPIENASLSVPISEKNETTIDVFRQHRFDCDPKSGVTFYLDDRIVHKTNHNTPTAGGNIQLKLWADGNRWWSGIPSTTDVHLSVRSIIAYYNVTESDGDVDIAWSEACRKAGGPSDTTICDADAELAKVGQSDAPKTGMVGGNRPQQMLSPKTSSATRRLPSSTFCFLLRAILPSRGRS